MKIKDTDKGMDALMRRLKKSNQGSVKVGILADAPKTGSSNATLLKVAVVHEFGTPKVPRRSFIADTVDPNQKKYSKFAAKQADKVMLGRMSRQTMLDQVGLLMVKDIKKRIIAGINPPLARFTVLKKGSSKQLIDTGQLLNSIAHQAKNG